MKLNKQWVSLQEIIGSNIRQLETHLQRRRVEINILSEVDFIYTDELILSRILNNLLTNAINYTPSDAVITIQASLTTQQAAAKIYSHQSLQSLQSLQNVPLGQKPQSYQITVTDDGKGLPLGMEEQIFERFTRGDSESSTTGLGLGLALSRDLVKHLGGSLSANNVQPHGAQFVIVLPWQPLAEKDMFEDKFVANIPIQ